MVTEFWAQVTDVGDRRPSSGALPADLEHAETARRQVGYGPKITAATVLAASRCMPSVTCE